MSRTGTAPVLECRGLHKTYRGGPLDVPVLLGVDLADVDAVFGVPHEQAHFIAPSGQSENIAVAQRERIVAASADRFNSVCMRRLLIVSRRR